MRTVTVIAMLVTAGCAPSGLDGFPCDFEGRCPGSWRCDQVTSTCVPGATCSAPLAQCGGDCALLSSDARHCGACGRGCAAGDDCLNGVCVPAVVTGTCDFCPPGTDCVNGQCSCGGRGELCSGVLCADTQQASASCGACFSPCTTPGTACRGGACVCPRGEKVCGGDCLDVDSDPANCGDCGQTCPMGQVCEAGQCVVACARNPQDACGDGRCWNVASDARHCGASCASCAPTQVCANGVCACPPGATDCNGACTDVRIDPQHCGACGTMCGVGEVCEGGQCACAPGLTRCGAECRLLSADARACGACGNACAAGQSCAQGQCSAACPVFMQACDDGTCPDLSKDPRNCGGCGSLCDASEVCLDGSCERPRPAPGCAACPCDACSFPDGRLCCLRGGVPYCIDGLRCPP